MKEQLNYGLSILSAALLAGSVTTLLIPNRQNIAVITSAMGGMAAGMAVSQAQKNRQQRRTDTLSLALREEIQPLMDELKVWSKNLNTTPETTANQSLALEDIQQTLAPIQIQISELHEALSACELSPAADKQPEPGDNSAQSMEEQNNGNSLFKEWLQARNLELVDAGKTSTRDTDFKRVATYLGENYKRLEFLQTHLIDAANHPGEQIEFKIKGIKERERILAFCDNLNRKGLLTFNRRHGSDTVEITTHQEHEINDFIKGKWFEYYVREIIVRWGDQQKGNHFHLMNPHVQLHHDKQANELDFLFKIREKFYWIECKAGKDFRDHLEKYAEHRKILQLPKEQALVVVLDLSKQQINHYSQKHDLTVVNERGVIGAIEKSLQEASNNASRS